MRVIFVVWKIHIKMSGPMRTAWTEVYNRALSRIFGPQEGEVKGGCRKLHNKETDNFFFLYLDGSNSLGCSR
jgi:hypothetical protein